MAELLLWEGQAAALTLTALAAGALLRRRERRLVMPLWWVWLLRLLCPLSLPLLTLPNPPAPALSAAGVSPPPAVGGALPLIWLLGAAALLLRSLWRRWRLGRALRFAVREEEGIWCCDALAVPCAVGLFQGRVYIPFRLPAEVRRWAIRHERTHLRRHDPLLLLLTETVCALHWWDPLIWLAAAVLRENMEMACDELTLRFAGGGERRAYFEAMLHFAAPAGPAPCFAATEAERRAAHVVSLRPLSRRAAGGIGAVLILCALPCFITAPPAPVPAGTVRFESETAFARAVCAAAARSDAEALSGMVRYPLTIRREGELVQLEGPKDFLLSYSRIMGAETIADLCAADPEDLFHSWGGVMIGQGGIWFEGSAENGFEIIAINALK